MSTRNILVNALLKSNPAASYDHMSLKELARTYYLMPSAYPIEIAPYLMAYSILQGKHHDTKESLNDFTRAIFGH